MWCLPDRTRHRLLGPVSAPVLVVAGAEDATFPVAETRSMADAIPKASFVVLDGVAHREDPARVNLPPGSTTTDR